MSADFHKLMHAGEPAKGRPVSDLNVTRELCAVCNRRVTADNTIVGNVYIGHQPVVVADRGHAVVLNGAAIE